MMILQRPESEAEGYIYIHTVHLFLEPRWYPGRWNRLMGNPYIRSLCNVGESVYDFMRYGRKERDEKKFILGSSEAPRAI